MKPTPPAVRASAITEPTPRWMELSRLTPARVALGRSGVSLPTRELLSFGLAHARARDAVNTPLDVEQLTGELLEDGWRVLQVHSRARDRASYLARPDWGRSLSDESRLCLSVHHDQGDSTKGLDLLLTLGDGLSSAAVQRHARGLLRALKPRIIHLRCAPIIIATQARVALADEIGERLDARVAVSIIGERPGLSCADSLGIYLTAQPRVGRSDAERNCISNIHDGGLSHKQAAAQCAGLIEAALRHGVTGIGLEPLLGLVANQD